jgi:non-ribosomal peptide synthetase component F
MERFVVPKEIADAMKEIARRTNSTLFMVLTALIAVLLKDRTGSADIPIGSAASGRKWSETESIVGLFLNTIVLRVDASGDPSFLQLVERVREMAISALGRDEVPFSAVVQKIAPQRNGSRHPLFQVMFSLEPPLGELEPGWKFTQMDVETGITKFDLHLEMDDRSEGILARFIYNADLFKKQTMLEMSKTYLHIARQAAANPGLRISDLVPARHNNGLMARIRGLLGTGAFARASSAW